MKPPLPEFVREKLNRIRLVPLIFASCILGAIRRWQRGGTRIAYSVMPGLAPGTHALLAALKEGHGRDKPDKPGPDADKVAGRGREDGAAANVSVTAAL
jgi:hypothetical protein